MRRPGRTVAADVYVALLYCVLAVALTWPVAAHFFTHLPADFGDPPFVAWLLSWQDHAMTHAPLDLFNAPIFHPFRGSLLLSETMFGGALVSLPVWLLSHSPAAAFNVVVLASFPISAFGMYLLVRDVTGARVAAIAAGIAFGFSMYRLENIAILHILLIMWVPYVVFFLRRFLRERRWTDALGIAGTAWLQLVSSGHGVLLLVFAVAVIGPVLAVIHRDVWRERTLWIRGVVAAVLLVVVSLPFVVAYFSVYRAHPEFRRTPAQVAYYSAGMSGFRNVPTRSITYDSARLGPVRATCSYTDECFWSARQDTLFPGIVVLAVALGAVSVLRSPRREERTWLFLFAAITVVAAALSIGTDESLRGPYGWAYRIVPALDTIRVPGRITILTTFGLAGLVGLSVSALSRWRDGRWKAAGIGVCALLLFDVLPKPARAVRAPLIPALYGTLARSPSRSALMELPASEVGDVRDEQLRPKRGTSHRDIPYMYSQTVHWRPLVNGYSGNRPPNYWKSLRATAKFPDVRSIEHLRKIGVGCVAIHRQAAARSVWRNAETKLRRYDATVLDDGEVFVVDVSKLPAGRGGRTGPSCL